MEFLKKSLPFLLVNILVSAVTMVAVLWFWQQRAPGHESVPVATQVRTIPTRAEHSQTTPVNPTQLVAKEGELSIEGVFGAGELNVEYILIRNLSDSSVNLNTWSVASDNGASFTLPYLVLNKNGAVRLYSKIGTNSVIELYWNSDQALWTSGDEIYLIDGSGQQQASWQVP